MWSAGEDTDDTDVKEPRPRNSMDTPQAKNDDPWKTQVRSFSKINYQETKAEVKKKVMMMEAAMPAVLVWNMFQMCQMEGISPAAAARRIFQTDMARESEEQLDDSSRAVLQKLDDLIRYHRRLRTEFEKAEELSEFRERQLKRKVLDLEMKAGRNRKLFEEMIADLRFKKSDSLYDVSLDSVSSHDLEVFEEMQRLAENEIVLKKKIDELERKERIYLKTLEQADEIWTALKSRSERPVMGCS